MGSIRKPESISKLAKLTATTLSLPASTLNIGGQQYNTLTSLTLNTATVGAGGVDATVTAGSLYYVYAVLSSNQVYLIASLNSSLPSGFTQARAVGGFTTDASSQIDQVGEYAGNLAVAGSVSAGGGLTSQPTQNFLINGAFDISQRYGNTVKTIGAGADLPPDAYIFDRWWSNGSADAYLQYQRVAITDLPGFQYAGSSKRINAASGNIGLFNQALEYSNVLPLQGKTITVSYYIKAPISPTYSLQDLVTYSTTADQKDPLTLFFTSSSYAVSTSWTRRSFSVSVPVNTKSLMIRLCRGTLNTVLNAEVQITGVMLNIGTSAAPFQRAGGTIGGELALCQRYYEKSYGQDVVPGTANSLAGSHILIAQQYGSNYCPVGYLPFKVTKRVNAVTSGVVYDAVTGSGTIIKSLLGAYQQNYYIANNDSGFWVLRVIKPNFQDR